MLRSNILVFLLPALSSFRLHYAKPCKTTGQSVSPGICRFLCSHSEAVKHCRDQISQMKCEAADAEDDEGTEVMTGSIGNIHCKRFSKIFLTRKVDFIFVKIHITEEYLGCYQDYVDKKRMMGVEQKQVFEMTLEWCFGLCRKDDYKLAGAQARGYCFCGNSFNTKKYLKRPESECKLTCWANSKQICGGDFRNSLFRLY